MILKLQEGCWYADGEGDPPRTCVEAHAKQFDTLANAQAALDKAVKYRKHISSDPFPDAEVIGEQ